MLCGFQPDALEMLNCSVSDRIRGGQGLGRQGHTGRAQKAFRTGMTLHQGGPYTLVQTHMSTKVPAVTCHSILTDYNQQPLLGVARG